MNIERRRCIRYQVPSNTIFLHSNQSPIHGRVKDISNGGMAFEYIPIVDFEIKTEITFILMSETFPFYLPNIPCMTIYDIKVDKNDWPFKVTRNRRCGVQYGKLDLEMREKLTLLLNSELMLS